ncbi:MAG: hypothetical protein OHK0022_55670 [Roseiflexaceae bacterium]
MMRVRWVSRVCGMLALLLAAAVGLGGLSNANAAPQPKSQSGVTLIRSSESGMARTAARRAWTKEEMARARPYPTPQKKSPAARNAPRFSGAAALAPQPDGPAGRVAFKKPVAANTASGPVTPLSFPVNPGVYGSYPFSTLGKLFFFQYGYEYVCSAALVKGHGIWTAGHCAHPGNGDPDGWSYEAIFVPQYYETDDPLGICFVTDWITPSDWFYNGLPDGLDYDYAGGNISCDTEDITDYTGYLGLAWNQSTTQFWRIVGYPAAPPFDGERQVQCASGRKAFGFGTPITIGATCDMTGGSSGGPWFIYGAYINGNVSYGDSEYPGLIFSPYLTSLAGQLWQLLEP